MNHISLITVGFRRFCLLSVSAIFVLVFSIATATSDPSTRSETTTSEESKQDKLPLEDVQRFTAALAQIKSYYVKPVADKDLFDDAIRGMLKGLDPHSSYLDQKSLKELTEITKGEFTGIGVEVTLENDLLKVITPIDGTPAAKAGLKSGDFIIKIGNKLVKGLTLPEAVSEMRGKIGSPIDLIILRPGTDKPLNFHITRDRILIQSVQSRLLDNMYGYIRISHFQEYTGRNVKEAIAKLQQQAKIPLKGLIVDLRNNPGGLLDSAIEVADTFIHNDNKDTEELIVFTKGRLDEAQVRAPATAGDLAKGVPIVVIINEGSASAAEIVAGALKDNHRALIVGKRSFGKGSVQTVLPLSKDTAMKLTTALYYTPSGKSIQAEGIIPNIIIEDVTIPKNNQTEAELDLKEADLHHHIANDSEKDKKVVEQNKKDQKTTAMATPPEDLLHTDYTLYSALNILKGLALQQHGS